MSRELLQRAYDRDAPGYDATFWQLQRPKYETMLGPRAEAIAGLRPLLDLGCGTGLLADFLAETGQQIEGIVGADLSAGMLACAHARGLPVVQADAARLPFVTGAFEAVVCFTVLRLFDDDERPALSEIARVLRPGGLLFLTLLTRQADGALVANLSRRGFEIKKRLSAGQDTGFLCRSLR